jgi:Kef-type K+ transport system membrane component KefB
MKRVGIRATIVAVVGVVVPFILGTAIVGPLLMPGLSQNAYLFLGAALTATSVGITARVFRDLGTVDTDEAKIVLGAAVIDDVIGLVILAVVSGIATLGAVSLGMISWILAKSVLFLVGAIIFGRLCAPYISKLFSKIHTGVGMKFTIVISFGLVFAFLSQLIGLAPIVGAFAAGLILEAVQFKYFKDPHVVEDLNEHLQTCRPGCKQRMEAIIAKHSNRHIIDFVEPLGLFLVPLFFIMTGAGVNLSVLFDLKVVLLALGIIVAAFLGKIVTGLVAGKGRDKWIVGWGMVPRGEVGLIFAAMGKSLNVINDTVYSVIVIVVMVSTLVPPVVLTYLINKNKKKKN